MPVYDLHASTQKREYPHETFLKENGIYTFFSKPCYVCRESVLSSTTIVRSSEPVMEVFSNPIFVLSEFSTEWTKYTDVKTFHFSDSLD